MTRADQVITYGMAEVGRPYVFGAEGPNAFDCSGLMEYIFAKVGVKLPRTAAAQQDYAQPVSGTPRPGDLVFYGDPAHHVGLYVGGGRMLAAPHSGARVQVQNVYSGAEYRRVPELGGISGAVGAVISPVSNPVQEAASSLLGSMEATARTVLVAAGGVALVALGAWQATKGEK